MINLALMGAGRMGKCHADELKSIDNAIIAGVFDPDAEAAGKFAETYDVKKVYASLGILISDKHVEVMIRQMLRKVVIIDGQDTSLSAGMQISLPQITNINRNALLSNKRPAIFGPTLLGISKASVETDSFLSAASFQETTKVLTDAAIKGKVDTLMGLKENVIIGKLIPAGTGSKTYRESTEEIMALAAEFKLDREERNADKDDFISLPEEMTRISSEE